MIVCKYGRSDNVGRRFNEHDKEYGSIEGVEVKLKFYVHIDESLASQAEVEIKKFFTEKCVAFKYKKYKELIIINKKQFKDIKKKYEEVEEKYSGRIKDVVKQMKELDDKLNNINVIEDIKMDSHNKEIALMTKQIEAMTIQYTELKKINKDMRRLIAEQEKTIAEEKARNKELEKRNKKMEKRNESLEKRNESLENKNESLENKNEKLTDVIEQLRMQIREQDNNSNYGGKRKK